MWKLKTTITGWSIEIFSRGGNPSLKSVIFHNFQEVEFADKITGKNIAKFSRGGIYKPSVQVEVLQNDEEVEFINHHYRNK